MVGVNYATGFLRADGKHIADTPLALLADHVDYLAERLGIEALPSARTLTARPFPARWATSAGCPA